MGVVRTVLGDIPASELGVTNAHEHLFIRNGLILVKQPDFRLDSESDAITEVTDFHDHGGQAIVDTAPLGIGRDPEALAIVSRSTGVHVIAATGFHKPEYYLDSHWRYRLSAEKIAELFVDEVSNGMDAFGFEGPYRQRTSARAGVIKAASDYQKISKASVVGFEAAARAHIQTGAPILTHTELGTMGAEQLDLLREFGVQSEHVVLSHADRNPDWMLHRDLAQTGAFLEYDGPGRAKYFPEITVIELMRKMFALGLGSQILLGGDTARRSYWKATGGGPGIAYIVGQFVPRLRKEGMLEEHIHSILIANPARAFSMSLNVSSDSR